MAAAAKVRSALGQIAQSERNWATAAIPYSPDLEGAYHRGLNDLLATIHSKIQNIEWAIQFLDPAEKKALAEDLSPAELQNVAFYEASLEAYKGICEAKRFLGDNNRNSLLEGCTDNYDEHYIEPVFENLVAAAADDPRTSARLLNAYHEASQHPLSPALSVMTEIPEIGPEDARLEYLNPFVTPDYHKRIVLWGDNFINRHANDPRVLRELVANLVTGIARNVTYPLTMTKTASGEPLPATRLGPAGGVVIAKAIAKINETGNTGELAAALAWLGVSPHAILSAADLRKVPDDALETVVFAAAQWSRERYLPESFEFRNALFELVEWMRKTATRGAFTEAELPAFQTDHLLIASDPAPLLGLIDAMKRPYFLPDGGTPAVRGKARALVIGAVAKAALAEASFALSTKDDAVFALDIANNPGAQKVVAAVDNLLEDHPAVILAALRELDRASERGEALTLLMLMHYDSTMLSQIQNYNSAEDAVSQIPLFRKGAPLYRVALQLWHGDGAVEPAVLDQAWEDDATRYWLSTRFPGIFSPKILSPMLDSTQLMPTLGRENLGYFLGAFIGTQNLAGTVSNQMEDRRDRGKRGPINLTREMTSLVPRFPVVAELTIAAKSMLAWNMEQHSFDVLVERDRKFHIFAGQITAAGKEGDHQPGTERIGVPSNESLRRIFAPALYGRPIPKDLDVRHLPLFTGNGLGPPANGYLAPMIPYQAAMTAGREFGDHVKEYGGFQGKRPR